MPHQTRSTKFQVSPKTHEMSYILCSRSNTVIGLSHCVTQTDWIIDFLTLFLDTQPMSDMEYDLNGSETILSWKYVPEETEVNVTTFM